MKRGAHTLFVWIVFFIFSLFGNCCLTVSSAFAEKKFPLWVEVKKDNINLRADATVGSAVVTTLKKADKLKAVAEAYEWLKVILPAGVKVFIYGKYLEEIGNGYVKVKGNNVNVRAGAGLNYPVLGQVDEGYVLKSCGNKKGNTGSWVCVYSDGKIGSAWVHSKFVKVLKTSFVNSNLVSKEKPEISGKTGKVVVNKLAEKDKLKENSEKRKPVLPQKGSAVKEKESDLPIAVGIVKEVGRVIGRKYRFKLVNKSGKVIYYLSGDEHSIWAFSDKPVKIYGEIIKVTKNNVAVIDVHKIELAR